MEGTLSGFSHTLPGDDFPGGSLLISYGNPDNSVTVKLTATTIQHSTADRADIYSIGDVVIHVDHALRSVKVRSGGIEIDGVCRDDAAYRSVTSAMTNIMRTLGNQGQRPPGDVGGRKRRTRRTRRKTTA